MSRIDRKYKYIYFYMFQRFRLQQSALILCLHGKLRVVINCTVNDVTTGCQNGNLWCDQWWQSWNHDKSLFSVMHHADTLYHGQATHCVSIYGSICPKSFILHSRNQINNSPKAKDDNQYHRWSTLKSNLRSSETNFERTATSCHCFQQTNCS